MPEWTVVMQMAAVGLLGGLLGGFLGIAGSVLYIPAMLFFAGLDYHTAQAAALVVNVLVGVSAVYGHWKSGKVIPSMLKILIPAAMAASVVGVLASNLFTGESQVWLRRVFGAAMAYVWLVNFYRLLRTTLLKGIPPWLKDGERLDAWRVGLVGAAMGSASGLLGIGGGTIVVPAQQILLRLRMRTAAANSSVAVIFASLLAVGVKYATCPEGMDTGASLVYAGLLIPPAAVGSVVGSHITHNVPRNAVRVIFLAMLLWAIWRMFSV